MFRPFRIFKESIVNVIRWFPTIWKDRDWDYDYLLEILKKKIEFMSEYTKKYGHSDGLEEDAKQMDEAVSLINKVQEGYFEEAFKPFNDLYPDFEPEMHFEDDKKHEGFKILQVEYESKEQENLYHKCLSDVRKLYEEGKRNLFDLLNDNIDGWWD